MLDPNEFPARYITHSKGSHPLGHEGEILANLLVVWAASFGLDECGNPLADESANFASGMSVDPETTRVTRRSSANAGPESIHKRPDLFVQDRIRRSRRDKAEAMLREVLDLVDFHGVLRRPSWDGVRILLLILPLLEGMYFKSVRSLLNI